jgi:ectoine hydroxylase-related dioxygenase (phytanoyl-CoA dioxygenase family)
MNPSNLPILSRAADAPFPRFDRVAVDDAAAACFRENGFMVVNDALTPAEIAELRREAVKICRGEYGAMRNFVPPAPGESDDEVMRRHLCVHMPHKISPVARRYVSHPAVIEVLTRVIGPNLKCLQSMLFIKAAGKPGQAWHQDEGYIPTRDRSLAAAWIALDDATLENGCLWVISGSHRRGVIWPQRKHDDARFDCTHEAHDFPYTERDEVPVEMPAGAMVVFNGYLLHRSLPNAAAAGFRRSLVNHYMSAESLLPWHAPKPGEYMGTLDFRDIVMVAGEDPYAWKGTVDVSRPHIRPTREGGCGQPKQNAGNPPAAAQPS